MKFQNKHKLANSIWTGCEFGPGEINWYRFGIIIGHKVGMISRDWLKRILIHRMLNETDTEV